MKLTFFLLSVVITVGIFYLERILPTYLVATAVFGGIVGVGAVVLVWVVGNKLTYKHFLKGAPFVRTQKKEIQTITDYLSRLGSCRVLDLGAGDANILISLAQTGHTAMGLEINPLLVLFGKVRIVTKGLQSKANIIQADLWQSNIENFDVVVLFGIPYMMNDLVAKLKKESKKGTLVISNKFQISDLKLLEQKGQVYFYEV